IDAPPAIGPESARAALDILAPLPCAEPWPGPLLQPLAAEAEQSRGPPARLCRHSPGRFGQRPVLRQAAEILLVQVPAGNGFNRALQLSECELIGQKFKDHRAVFQLGAQPCDGGGEDAAVI